MHLIDTFDRGVREAPDGDCFVMADGAGRMTYRQVEEASHRIAASLLAAGVGKGHRVGVLSPNAPMAFVCILGALRADASWVPLNTRAVAKDLVALLGLTGCELLFYHPSLVALTDEIRAELPQLHTAVCLDTGGRDGDPVLAEWMAAEGARVPRPPHDRDHPAVLFPTGGTTGRSKAVQLTHGMVELMNLAFAAHMPEPERPPVMAMAAPMTHAAGPICFPVFARAGTVVVHDGVDPQRLLESIARHRVTRLFLPPTAIYALLAHPGVRDHDYSSLRHFIYAAAPMSVSKLREAIEVFGPVMTQTFGQAEAPMILTVMSPQDHADAVAAHPERLASAGRPSLVAEVAIMDDEGTLLPAGEVGEIVVRGSLVTPGYFEDPEQSAANHRPGGWHGTSDVGRVDEAGFVYLVDRKRDMIITGGFNVWPSEIEQTIHAMEGVADVAVIGLPDEVWGEAVTAVVQMKPGFDVLDVDAVRARCKARLGSVKAPKHVLFRELPRSPAGKVLKRALRDEYRSAAGAAG
ncbi:AMP-binding protein [Conexibacter sp. W3-3-2]|uniref:class I adenylate-forming enzyme family protein n=1 Tax=Conexibacter sp. W3-3-2 TaxID=2675227 RepID=UPI0013251E4B|nr:AMP-binding protein [Conexibacter sp. W3-3-2]MTD44711.1 AMP-binding protein [Conexibacter sp. W3-3-2]